MPNDAPLPKATAPSPILDRFRLLLKERENEFRVSSGVDDDSVFVAVPPPSAEEIVRFYEDVLSELTFNSKPIITDLTIIAGEQREHGEGIADAVCARVLEVPVEQKLPSLYLLDSIVKNIGRDYVRHFSARLPEVFCEVYTHVPPNMHSSMRHLFGTWSTVFPPSVLRKIEDALEFSPRMNQPSSSIASMRTSESPRPSHGIHVNPKYLEARRKFDNSSINNNVQLARGTSNFKSLGQKHSVGYEDFDSEQGHGVTSNLGVQRFGSAGYGGRTSFPLSTDKMLPSVSGPGRPLSSLVDEYAVSESPGRGFERSSPSHAGYNQGRKMRGRDDDPSDWQKRLRSDDLYRGFENVTSYSLSNGLDHDRPRALIDAYGHDDGQRPLIEKSVGMDNRIVNGGRNKIAAHTWQNTEEDEFDWEDMSPTLADWKTNDLSHSSTLPSGSFRARSGLDPLGPTPFDNHLRKSNWTTSNRICRLEDSQKPVEDASLIRDSGRESSNKSAISRNQINQNSEYHHSQGVWKLPGSVTEPVQNLPGVGKPSQADDFSVVSNVTSRVVSSGFSSFEGNASSPAVAPVSAGLWPSTGVNNMMSLPPLYQQQQQHRSPLNYMNPSYRVPNRGPQPFDNDANSAKPTQMQQPGFTPLHHPTRPPVSLHQQMPLSQELRQNSVPNVAPLLPHMIRPSVSLGYTPLGHGANNIVNNLIPSFHTPLPIQNVSNGSVQFQAPLTTFLPGPRPPSQMLPLPQSSGPLANQLPAVSGLINSLVAQGVLSLAKQTPAQESLGVEFNPDLLKVRHMSSIRALYEDLPRQCTTCGLRFKTQEEHSKHMDWHVTKNRISRNRKHNPSRKWFVSASMWLSGAEALGTDSAPGFLPAEDAVEKKDDEEMAVPADEDQNACALCGEAFEDFYSDETEEWMYRGAVYLNVADGSVAGMDRSQLGPIVHAKCRSETSVAPV